MMAEFSRKAGRLWSDLKVDPIGSTYFTACQKIYIRNLAGFTGMAISDSFLGQMTPDFGSVVAHEQIYT